MSPATDVSQCSVLGFEGRTSCFLLTNLNLSNLATGWNSVMTAAKNKTGPSDNAGSIVTLERKLLPVRVITYSCL